MTFTVAITAAETRPLTKMLQAKLPQYRVIGAPVTHSRPVSSAKLPVCLQRLQHEEYDWAIVTSARTVKYLQQILAGNPSLNTFPQVAAVGKASATAASNAGWRVTLQGEGNATDLARQFANISPGGQVFLPGSSLSKPDLAKALSEMGYQVDTCPLYTMAPVSACPEEYFHADAVAVTAGSNLRALTDFGIFPRRKDPARSLPYLVCIGEPSAQVAHNLGLKVDALAPTPDAAGLAEALRTCLKF
ncbi:uroporphyrinogen-III synthase [Varibaculum vaginae]|uniref:uroporphyrinogen-III synthase n=1 Tax=Varibaculum vaginae TaxID=2364797 RepID=UPI000F076060|nr:uroporphyrinogen-III synthase [Varibaculum vaginae]